METQYTRLSMTPSGVPPVIYMSQNDIGRPIGFICDADLSDYSVVLEGTRTDGTPITVDVTVDGNICAFETTATMTNKADVYIAQIVVTNASGKHISSIPIKCVVVLAAMDENSEGIEEDAPLYQQYTGTVQSLIADIRTQLGAEASARQAADNQLQSNINAEASTRATQDASLQSQINQLIAPSGSAPSAAEVENARVGADGTTYPTLGDAIRTQDTQLKSALDEVQRITCTSAIVDILYNTIPKYLIGNAGAIIYLNDDRYVISDYIPVEEGHKYVITASANYNNCIFAWYDSNKDVVSVYNPGSSGGTVKEVISEEFIAPENSEYLVVASFNKPSEVKENIGLENILEKRVERLERDLPEKPNTIMVSKDGDNITVKDITSGNYVTYSLHSSNNGAFNFGGYYDANSTLIKQAGDDICPVYYDFSYRCGNHGNNVVRQATIISHGLTEADIGKVFTSSTQVKYVLVRIVDANTLWFIHNSSSHTFVTGQMATPLTDGTITLNIESNQLVQLFPSINNIKQTITIDGASALEDGVYYGREIIISESYGSVDTLEVINALKNNVGNNTNTSYYADSLPCDLFYTVNYKTSKGLQTVVESKIVVLRDGVNITRFGVTQSQQIKDGRRILAPYTTDNGLITINASDNYIPEKWASNNFPPSKIYQFDTQSTIGFAIAYMTDYGNALPTNRTADCTVSAINISSAGKVYPFVIYTDNNPLDAMTEIYAVAVRKLVNLDNTMSIEYEENGALYVEIEKRTTDDADISVPTSYNNKIITVLHKSGNVYVPNVCVENNSIAVKGMGSLSIKIT